MNQNLGGLTSEPEKDVPIEIPEHQTEAYRVFGDGVIKGFCYTGIPEEGGISLTEKGKNLIAKCWQNGRLFNLSGLEGYLNLVFWEAETLEQMDYHTEALRLGELFTPGRYDSKEKLYHFVLAAFLATKSIKMGLLEVEEREEDYLYHRKKS